MKDHVMAPELRFRFRGQRQTETAREFFFEDCLLDQQRRGIHVVVSTSELSRRRIRLQDAQHFCLQVIVSRCASLPDDLLQVIRFEVSEKDLPMVDPQTGTGRAPSTRISMAQARAGKRLNARTGKRG